MESLVSSSWFCFASPPLPSHNGMFSRLKEFCCGGCNSMEKLFPLELLSYLVNLEVISVFDCEKMEEIIGTTDEESSTSNPIAELTLPKLKTLELKSLPELKRICNGKLICNSLEVIHVEDCEKLKRMAISLPLLENGQPIISSILQQLPPILPSHNGIFSRLKKFHCAGRSSMEKLFPLELLSYLVNLEEIVVTGCERMEEIIGTTDEESSTSNPIVELTLPKLTTLQLFGLPELKGICSAKLICNSLRVIYVSNCAKLKRMAISLPLLENGQPSPHPSLKIISASPEEWWETVVEWEPPNAKEVLRPIVHFW
uniref:Disease resistance protein At4g27190-like leucine-rich repeats domain-containing protein n=1 Tax=Salix viminalis TaxID=40686 RepID=A0A6N2KXB6_SALVM